MNKIVGRDTLISYSNFREIIIIHTDTRKIQSSGVIGQNGNPIDFY